MHRPFEEGARAIRHTKVVATNIRFLPSLLLPPWSIAQTFFALFLLVFIRPFPSKAATVLTGMFSLSTRFSARVVTITALCTILLSAASPAQAIYDRRDSGVRNTTWTPCQDDPSYLCGSIVVPLDWSGKESTGNATIGVVKYSATQANRKGSIFVNPGSRAYRWVL